MANFADILKMKKEDIKDPQSLPAGEYRCTIAGAPELGESQQKKTPYARMTYNVVDLVAGDQEAFAAVGATKDDGSPRQIGRDDYYLTGDSAFRIRDFLNSVIGDSWSTLSDAFEQLQGREVIVTLGYEQDKNDANKSYQRVRKAIGTANS